MKSLKDKTINKTHSFGPQITKLKQIEINRKVKKLIHYDCNINNGDDGLDEDVPDEDEIYIKENLLSKKDNNSNSE